MTRSFGYLGKPPGSQRLIGAQVVVRAREGDAIADFQLNVWATEFPMVNPANDFLL